MFTKPSYRYAMARNLVSPSKIRERIGAVGNPQDVTQAILAALARGTIYAQADLTVEIDRSQSPPAEKQARGKKVDKAHWNRIAADEDMTAAIWSRGSATLEDPRLRVELHDISFDDDQLQPIFDNWAVAKVKKTFATTGRVTAEWWSDFAVELTAHFYSKGIPEGIGSEGSESVVHQILDRLSKVGHAQVSPRSIRETVQKALIRVREN